MGQALYCLENTQMSKKWLLIMRAKLEKHTQKGYLETPAHIDSQALSWYCAASQQVCSDGKEEEGLGKEVERKKGNHVCETAKETQMYRTVFWTLWERARVG